MPAPAAEAAAAAAAELVGKVVGAEALRAQFEEAQALADSLRAEFEQSGQ